MSDLVVGDDGLVRCSWHGNDPLYAEYHDREWGRPVVADPGLFERISLEGFQAGLSWLTILRKREAFRRAFAGFAPDAVAEFEASDVARLMGDAGIVRNRAKIEATIANARLALDLIDDRGSLARYLVDFRGDGNPAPRTFSDLPATSLESERLSRDLKRRGWRFVGPTTMYALMQAVGLVNDHLLGCHAREACDVAQREAWDGL